MPLQGKFDFSGKSKEGKEYKIDVELFGKVNMEGSKWTNTGRQVQVLHSYFVGPSRLDHRAPRSPRCC